MEWTLSQDSCNTILLHNTVHVILHILHVVTREWRLNFNTTTLLGTHKNDRYSEARPSDFLVKAWAGPKTCLRMSAACLNISIASCFLFVLLKSNPIFSLVLATCYDLRIVTRIRFTDCDQKNLSTYHLSSLILNVNSIASAGCIGHGLND